jgi:hypothetical protein
MKQINKGLYSLVFLLFFVGSVNGAICIWSCNLGWPESNITINQYETFVMYGSSNYIAGTCTLTGSVTAQMSNNNGSSYATITDVTNLTTSDPNPSLEIGRAHV